MLAKEILLTHFRYNKWANGRILDEAAKLPKDQLMQPSLVGERSLQQILAHLIRVEKVWRLLAMMGYVEPGHVPDDSVLRDVTLMQDFLTEEHEKMLDFLETLSEGDLEEKMTITRWDGVKFAMIRWQMLSHLLLHSMQHRSEAAIMLTNFGMSPGDIDFLFFAG